MSQWTIQDMRQGLCTVSQVGKDKPTMDEAQSTMSIVQSLEPKEFINEWMEVYRALGGRQGLIEFAAKNPIKFYDQLMKLLVAMEAPKQLMGVLIEREDLSTQELEKLTTVELKRRLMISAPTNGEIIDVNESPE